MTCIKEERVIIFCPNLCLLFSSIAVSALEAWTLNQAVGLFLLISSCLYFSSHFCFSDNSTFRAISATSFSFFPAKKKDHSTCQTVYCYNIQLFHLRHLVAFQKCDKIQNKQIQTKHAPCCTEAVLLIYFLKKNLSCILCLS